MNRHRSLARLVPVVLCLVLAPGVATKPQSPTPQGPKYRRVAATGDVTGSVSRDGRYYAFTNWQTGQLGIKNLSSEEDRYIVTPGSEGASPYMARFSPDGSRIAFTWMMEDGAELRVVNADGSGLRTLHRGYGEIHDWSPDGKHILAGVGRETVLVSISDGSFEVLSDGLPAREMRFSPDGRYVAYDSPQRDDSPDHDIFLLEIDGGRVIPLVEGPGIERVLDWTPDGDRLLFDSDRGLAPGTGRRAWLIEVADGKPAGGPELVEPEIVVTRGLGFGRDGAYYFVGYCCRGDLWLADSTGLYLATLDPATGERGAPTTISKNEPGKPVAWSPDGQFLAQTWQQWPFPSTLGIRSVRTGEERRLPLTIQWAGDSFGLRWSPDGRSLLVQGRDLNGRWGIYRVDVQTGAATPIAQGCCVGWPTWSPDGNVIYASWEGSDTVRIVARDTETGDERELQRIPPPAHLSELATSPDGRWLAFFWSDVPSWWETRGMWALKVIPIDGGEPRDLTPLSVQGFDSLPRPYRPSLTWTHDSRHVVYAITTVTNGEPSARLWRIAAEGGEPRGLGPVMEEFGLGSFSLHPDGRQIAYTGGFISRIPEIRAREEILVLENFLPATVR